MTVEDLRDTDRLLELHRQAVGQGWSRECEAARLDFFALAERSRAQAHDPPALFSWLLKNQRFDFITLADEDAAADRLRELRDGPRRVSGQEDQTCPHQPEARRVELSDDDRFVQVCIQVAKTRRGWEPSRIAREGRGWSLDRWEAAHWSYTQKQFERWHVVGDE